jgi:hypothetical protein
MHGQQNIKFMSVPQHVPDLSTDKTAQSVQQPGYMLDGPGFKSVHGQGMFLFSNIPHHPWVPPRLLARVNRSERDTNCCPFTVELKNEWRHASILAACLHSVDTDKFALKTVYKNLQTLYC